MLKAEVNEKVSIELSGDLRRVCADISTIICAVNERLTEKDPEMGHAFKVLFTKGFMDGVCFGDDREHMEHYLAEGDKMWKIRNKDDAFEKLLDDLLEFLRDKNAQLDAILARKEESEDDDEAE